jgi:hypothetical protein
MTKTALTALLSLVIGAIVSGAGVAGSLDPPPSAVDGSGNPISTGGDIPAWSKNLDSTNGVASGVRAGCDSDRFTCVFNDKAVLDNETGLVWERTPNAFGDSLVDSVLICLRLHEFITDFDHGGWRVPTISELASLYDATQAGVIKLPTGHPFGGTVEPGEYWSVTGLDGQPTLAFTVDFGGGGGSIRDGAKLSDPGPNRWCVRGPAPGMTTLPQNTPID